ncbi:DUF6291 domain-containing protein [Intestinimonas butyriciproducens]|uniref:DUF6291 domain-containing protein n=1 Tax=Intestinimonas butyriciproducens TaxID=1297617 RepID=UPI00195DC091|nr:DUF6291 domain-containing protein [Intestinimonas butyriciproducens]MBM6918525.1 hypothetical protein [Intestinimonas butyriciproducens]
MAREYICLYHSYRDAIQALDDAERGRLLTAMLEYTLTGDAGNLRGNERFVFPLIKSQIDRDNAKYARQCERNAANGKNGGRPRNPKNPVGFSETEKSQDKGEYEGKDKDEYEEEYEGEYENENENKEEEKREGEGECKGKEKEKAPGTPEGVRRAHHFHPPTLSQVRDYVYERNSPVDPQGFLDFYQAKGWMVGNTPMQDWKAALRNAESWERWQRQERQQGAYAGPDPYGGGEGLWSF